LANISRDSRNMTELSKLGWQSLVIWSCEINKIDTLEEKIKDFMG
jgi:DNA mismatch endonuclease, patch repair protein